MESVHSKFSYNMKIINMKGGYTETRYAIHSSYRVKNLSIRCKQLNMYHMNGGTTDTSYAINSSYQRNVISKTKLTREQAISDLYRQYCEQLPNNLCIADLGCSSGANTFLVISQVIRSVVDMCKKLGHDDSPEFQVYFNDLPSNDFNEIFRSLPQLHNDFQKEFGPMFGPCLFYGVPGSFYNRLFKTNSVHFINCTHGLNWLSKVPELAETNKGNVHAASTSPKSVITAYSEQFKKDFSRFLEHRAKEMVVGGQMVLAIWGRNGEQFSSKNGSYIWDILAASLNEMVIQGLIEEEKFDAFNIPSYTPSLAEVKFEIEKEGSFSINCLDLSVNNWKFCVDSESSTSTLTREQNRYNFTKFVQAVTEPLLVSQFGDGVIADIFKTYNEILEDSMAEEESNFDCVNVSLTRKG